MTTQSYADLVAEARTGRASFTESSVRALLSLMLWPEGVGTSSGSDWLDRDEALTSLIDLPFTIANVVSDNLLEKAIDPSHADQTEAFVMYVHGINRYDFTTARAEESVGKVFNRTNPDWLRGGPKLAYAILKEAGLDPTLTTDQAGDPAGLGGTRLVVPVAGESLAANSSSTQKRWADGYDRLPDQVNETLVRMSDLYHWHHGYGIEERRQLSRKLSMHVNALLRMDADTLDAWHQENLRLVAEVEKTAKSY